MKLVILSLYIMQILIALDKQIYQLLTFKNLQKYFINISISRTDRYRDSYHRIKIKIIINFHFSIYVSNVNPCKISFNRVYTYRFFVRVCRRIKNSIKIRATGALSYPLESIENRARWNLFDSPVRWSPMTFVFQRMTRFNEFNEHPQGWTRSRGQKDSKGVLIENIFPVLSRYRSTGHGSVVNLFHTFVGINQISFAVMLAVKITSFFFFFPFFFT